MALSERSDDDLCLCSAATVAPRQTNKPFTNDLDARDKAAVR